MRLAALPFDDMRTIFRLGSVGLATGAVLLAAVPAAVAHGSLPGEPTLLGALTTWTLEPLPWIGTILAGAAYLIAARKVNATGPRVPIRTWRTAAWLAGLAAILIALGSAVDAYAEDFLSVHMVQHLLLTMVAPPLLALGAPITLLLRVASPSARRRLILPILHSRFVRVIASPFIGWTLFTVAMFATHFSGLYNAALESPTLHDAEHLVYLITGALFWWPVVAADPIPHRLGYGERVVYVILQMPVNAAVGLAIYFAPAVLYPHYASLTRTWGPTALVDQQIGGGLMWGVGDVLLLMVVPLIVAAWMRADARRAQIRDAVLRAEARQRA